MKKTSTTLLAAALACAFIAPAYASLQRTSAPEQVVAKKAGKSKTSKPKAPKPAKA